MSTTSLTNNKILCNLCGSDHYAVVYDSTVDFPVRIVKCLKCGLMYTNPRPGPTQIKMNYEVMTDEYYIQEEQGLRRSANFILSYFKNEKKGRLLDVGCATGFLLDEARKQGWEVYGVELSAWASDYAKNKLQLPNIVQGSLKEANYPANFFDVVIFNNVIEHLTEPKEALEQIRRVLKPAGIICCNTPDVDSLASKVFGSKWWGIRQSHLYYFNKQTLSDMFEATGFVPLKVRSHARSFTINYWIYKFLGYRPSFKFLRSWLNSNAGWTKNLVRIDIGDQIEIFCT